MARSRRRKSTPSPGATLLAVLTAGIAAAAVVLARMGKLLLLVKGLGRVLQGAVGRITGGVGAVGEQAAGGVGAVGEQAAGGVGSVGEQAAGATGAVGEQAAGGARSVLDQAAPDREDDR